MRGAGVRGAGVRAAGVRGAGVRGGRRPGRRAEFPPAGQDGSGMPTIGVTVG